MDRGCLLGVLRRCAVRIGGERVCVGCVWCGRAMGIGEGRDPLGVSGGGVPWGLVGGVSCLAVLGEL